MTENFEENIGFLINDVARFLRVSYDRKMATIGLTRSQWLVLSYLYFNEGINQSEFALILDIEKAPLSRLLYRMEMKGFINRKSEGEDRRIKNIYLSDSIKPFIISMRDQAAIYRKESFSILDIKEQKILRDLLQKLKKDLSTKALDNIK
ncbi:MarR family transcriptional regulator [Alphaproteobacteria bacterium]|jgi:MarR family transcriptional regulator for hemolysin|nr:MarR family transcriptional regulator [Alphaproteobacteria bacterium]MDB9871676.1 MarR family transcriptional regulator [Alphaproteobacteria bacterium]|tara:strand:- start:139 stop:588 length:450 start_codon:yes stop_codon:yes gene_type:complete